MLIYLFLGFLLLLAVVGLMVAYTRAEPTALARGLRWATIAFAAAGLILLPFGGRLSLIAFGPALLIPMFTRMLLRRSQDWSRTGTRSGQTSSVETAWLAVTLDHDSGRMEGTVRQGSFVGRQLSSLDLAELLALRTECGAADPDSVALVEAFLDRVHGAGWRTTQEAAGESGPNSAGGTGPGARPAPGGMTREEAYEILGLAPGADADAVKEAHRRLMQKLHPDHGGSTYLAAKINQAKDLLIGN